MNSKDRLIEYFNNLEEVKRIKELEGYIDNNKDIKNIFNELKDLQKKLVNAKEYNQINQYNAYLKEYNNLKNELLDLPFVEEYLELLDYVNNMLNYLTKSIEMDIDKKINS